MVIGTPCSGPRSLPPRQRRIGRRRLLKRLLEPTHHHDIQGPIVALDAIDVVPREFDGADFLAAEARSEFSGGLERELVGHGASFGDLSCG